MHLKRHHDTFICPLGLHVLLIAYHAHIFRSYLHLILQQLTVDCISNLFIITYIFIILAKIYSIDTQLNRATNKVYHSFHTLSSFILYLKISLTKFHPSPILVEELVHFTYRSHVQDNGANFRGKTALRRLCQMLHSYAVGKLLPWNVP